jgi:hypothetical protein
LLKEDEAQRRYAAMVGQDEMSRHKREGSPDGEPGEIEPPPAGGRGVPAPGRT